jgi:hypothetical protein
MLKLRLKGESIPKRRTILGIDFAEGVAFLHDNMLSKAKAIRKNYNVDIVKANAAEAERDALALQVGILSKDIHNVNNELMVVIARTKELKLKLIALEKEKKEKITEINDSAPKDPAPDPVATPAPDPVAAPAPDPVAAPLKSAVKAVKAVKAK